MTDEEYQEFLDAIYRRYVRAWRAIHHPEGLGHLNYMIEHLASTSRFARAVAERAEHVDLYPTLGEEIEYTYFNHPLDESGILDALDAHAEQVFGGLRRSAIPDVDLEYLRLAGFDQPDAEVVLIIRYARDELVTSKRIPSQTVARAREELQRVGKALKSTGNGTDERDDNPKKPPKLFNGISKILAGGVTAAGNMLLAVGSIAAPGPATGHAVIASCALAVAAIGQGIGDLCGE
ncbi:MAG: hypothetical protein Q8Q12_10465 [bacterium]|nr:hypothetical protein [bacterium]